MTIYSLSWMSFWYSYDLSFIHNLWKSAMIVIIDFVYEGSNSIFRILHISGLILFSSFWSSEWSNWFVNEGSISPIVISSI